MKPNDRKRIKCAGGLFEVTTALFTGVATLPLRLSDERKAVHLRWPPLASNTTVLLRGTAGV